MNTDKTMDLTTCVYCGWPGLVMTVRLSPAGFDVTGKCQVCGYTYDSISLSTDTDTAMDWTGEASQPRERLARD